MTTAAERQGFFNRLANPTRFMGLADAVLPWLTGVTVILLVVGLYLAFFQAPPDYQQGHTVKIMFIHVPFAWLAMMGYSIIAVASIGSLIWRHPMADVAAKTAAPIGACFTLLALVTGSLWGKPMWGTYWEWDPRLTSELILLFLYLGYISLREAYDDLNKADRASAVLALVGVVNLPIIHYSVVWWSSIHQGPTIKKLDAPSITWDMAWPLFAMIIGFTLFFVAVLLERVRAEVLRRERNARWIADVVEAAEGR